MDHQNLVKRYEDFIFLKKKGLSFANIGKKYGISRQAVQQRIKNGTPQRSFGNGNDLRLAEVGANSLQGRERTRMLVRIRDKFTCQDCGDVRTPKNARENKKRLFDIHHLNGLCGKRSRSYDRVKDMAGLITLCHKCHFNRPEHKSHNPAPRKKLT